MLDLTRDSFGRLVLVAEDEVHRGVVPVRAFPISAPGEWISLIAVDGHEVGWVAQLDDLPEAARGLIEEALAGREFMPSLLRIVAVSGYATPCTWQVETDRGKTSFTLQSEDEIRRLSPSSLLIGDSQGVHYLIADLDALNPASRKLLDRFL